jgi:hypothetical protein
MASKTRLIPQEPNKKHWLILAYLHTKSRFWLDSVTENLAWPSSDKGR